MKETQYGRIISQEIGDIVGNIDQQQLSALVEAIVAAKRVFVCGAGRSLLMMRAFAMRLMYMGVEAYVVGETVTPAIADGDLLIAGSGSGQTRGTLATVQAATAHGAQTAVITAHGDSQMAEACDLVVVVPLSVTDEGGSSSPQPLGSLFELSLLVVGDVLVIMLMKRIGATNEQMLARHTNLE